MTRTVVSWDEDPTYCGRVHSDGSGNLYTNTEHTLSNERSVLLPVASLLATLNAGFTAHSIDMTSGVDRLVACAPDGKVLSSTPLIGRHSTPGVQARGGSIAIEAECNVTKTIRNQNLVKVDVDNNLLLVRGAVPGPNGGYVVIRETNVVK